MWTVLLSAQRMDSGPAGTSVPGLHRLMDGTVLPPELWLAILAFVARRDWPATRAVAGGGKAAAGRG